MLRRQKTPKKLVMFVVMASIVSQIVVALVNRLLNDGFERYNK